MKPIPLQSWEYNCSRPFYEIMADGDLFQWLPCPYSISGLGITGVGAFMLLYGFVGLKNWSESWTLPMTWLAIMTPAMAAVLLPGALLRRIAGLITVAVVLLFVGLYWWWGRA
jgi:hypothetical protein